MYNLGAGSFLRKNTTKRFLGIGSESPVWAQVQSHSSSTLWSEGGLRGTTVQFGAERRNNRRASQGGQVPPVTHHSQFLRAAAVPGAECGSHRRCPEPRSPRPRAEPACPCGQ